MYIAYLLLQTNWQEESHAIKLIDAANQVVMFLQHWLAHATAWHLRVVVHTVLEQVEVWSSLKHEQVWHQINGRSTGAYRQTPIDCSVWYIIIFLYPWYKDPEG